MHERHSLRAGEDEDPMHKIWVPHQETGTTGYYQPGQLELEIEGESYRVEPDFYETELPPGSSQQAIRDRVDLVVQPKSGPAKRTILFFPGWGESSAMFAGDLLGLLVNAETRLVIPNGSGRGTLAYAESGVVSFTSYSDWVNDAKRLPGRLKKRGLLGKELVLIGHSLGYQSALAFAEAWKGMNKSTRLTHVLGLMPATDEPLALPFSPRFLAGVAPHVIPAVQRCFTGQGLAATQRGYNALMLGDAQSKDAKTFEGCVPDSARVFLEWTGHVSRFPHAPHPDIKVHLAWSANDSLLPPGMGEVEADRLKKQGYEVTGEPLYMFPHALPTQMSPGQHKEMSQFLQEALG